MGSIAETVARNLVRWRGLRGLGQKTLAEAAGCHKNTIGKIEKLTQSPTVNMLEVIAKTLGVDTIDLLYEPDPRDEAAIADYLGSPYVQITAPTPEEVEWLRGRRLTWLFGGTPSRATIDRMIDVRRRAATDART